MGRSLIWDWILGTSEETPPDYVWIGFATSVPTEADTGSSIVELRSSYVAPLEGQGNNNNQDLTYETGYKRVKYPFGIRLAEQDRGWKQIGNGAYTNTITIDFGSVPADSRPWPTVRAWFMATDRKYGDLFAYGPTGTLNVQPGDHVSIPSGSLMLQTVPMSI